MLTELLPSRLEQILLRIRSGDLTGAQSFLDNFCEQLAEESCCEKLAKIITLELMLAISREIKTNKGYLDRLVDLDYNCLKRIDSDELLGHFCQWIRNDLLGAYCQFYSMSKPNRNTWLVDNIKAFVNQHYSEQLTLSDLSKEFSFSPYYITRVFKKETDYRLFDYLTTIRLRNAKTYLMDDRTGKVGIAEVSKRVGFEDVSYFGKVFRKHFGLTPSQFRDQNYASRSPDFSTGDPPVNRLADPQQERACAL